MSCRVVLVLALLGGLVRSAFAESKVDPFFVPRPDFYGPTVETLELEQDEQSPPNLAHQIAIDFKNVFTTPENLVIVGVGAAAALGASHFDDDIANSRFNS